MNLEPGREDVLDVRYILCDIWDEGSTGHLSMNIRDPTDSLKMTVSADKQTKDHYNIINCKRDSHRFIVTDSRGVTMSDIMAKTDHPFIDEDGDLVWTVEHPPQGMRYTMYFTLKPKESVNTPKRPRDRAKKKGH